MKKRRLSFKAAYISEKNTMKQNFKILLNVSAASALALTAVGQEMSNPQAAEHQRMSDARTQLMKDTVKASDFIGMTVEDSQHVKLGKVNGFYLNLKSGRIVQVIVSGSGPVTAVPPTALHNDFDRKMITLDATKEKFLAAPAFDAAKCDAITESNRVNAVYVYYGQQSYFVANPQGYWTTNQNGTLNMDGTQNKNPARNAEIARHVGDDSNVISTQNKDGSQSENYYSNGNRAINSWSSLGNVRKSSHLMGMTVVNLQNEKLGSVKNFIVDLSAGRIAAVIIISGGFLGSGDLSAVPPTSLQYDAAHDNLQLDATKEMLAYSPSYNVTQWPNFRLAGYNAGNYYPYKIAPYNNADAPLTTNTSAQTMADRDNHALTPMDQGKSAADLDITAQIRQEIMADQGMSMNAKNVKIITIDGRVTLRGVVNTSEEKSRIAEIALRIAHQGNVDNQLEVQATTSN
jgi:hyperosmotically inducible protein